MAKINNDKKYEMGMNKTIKSKSVIELFFEDLEKFSSLEKIKTLIVDELNKFSDEQEKLKFLNRLEKEERNFFASLVDTNEIDIKSATFRLNLNIQIQIKDVRNEMCIDKTLSFLMIENEPYERIIQQFDEKIKIASSFIEKDIFIKEEIKRIKDSFIQPIIISSPNIIPGSMMNYSEYRKYSYEWLSAGQDWSIKNIITNVKSSYLAGGGKIYLDSEFDSGIVDNLRDGISYILYEQFLNQQLTKSENRKGKTVNTSKKKRLTIPNKLRAVLQQEIKSSCPFCDSKEVAHFEIHHIDENPGNNELSNLLMLCPICHSKVTKGDIATNIVSTMKLQLLSQHSILKAQ